MLSYTDLLTIATAESERLRTLIEELKTELFQMSAHYLKSGWNKGFSDYYAQRREVYTRQVYAEADLQRCRGYAAILRKDIAAGRVREAVAVAQAA